jgi:tol-pal system protein YbgF
MLFRRLTPILLLFPALSLAASKEMTELMRDVALLQQQVKDLQQSQDSKFTALTVLVQQTLDTATKANTAVAVLDSGLGRTVQEQLKGAVTASVGVGTKVDSMGGDVQALRGAVEDITAKLGKLQQQLSDLSKAMQAMQSPAACPPAGPPPSGPGGTTPATGGTTAPPPANLPPAAMLYDNANRDRMGGKLDLAIQEFQDYLRYYGNTDLAPNAQYYIGFIHFGQNDFESALADFDAVLEKYPDNNKTPDALLMKGRTLVKMGRPTQGAAEFRELIKRFPTSDQATAAKAQLKALGLPYNSATPARKKTK